MIIKGILNALWLTISLSVVVLMLSCASNQEVTPLAQGDLDAQRWALLVAIDDYESDHVTDLRYAKNDVQSLAHTLAATGYPASQIIKMTDDESDNLRPTNNNLLFQLDRFASRLGPEDTFFFYFSGHGVSRDEKAYLLSINTDPRTDETLQLTSTPLSLVTQKLNRIPASSLVVIDACRNAPERGKGATDNPLTDLFAKSLVIVPKSNAKRATLFACSLGERAYEWDEKRRSVFSHYLIEHIETSEEPISVNSLSAYVKEKVGEWADMTGVSQTPWAQGDGELVVAAPIPTSDEIAPTETGRTLFSDDFSASLDSSKWLVGGGRWRQRSNGTLESTRHHQYVSLWVRQPIVGNFAIEFDAMTDEHGGFSVLLNGLGKGNAFDTSYHIGLGHDENRVNVIQRLGQVVDEDKVNLLEYGRLYHVRIESSDGTIAVWLDGAEVMQYVDPEPLAGELHRHVAIAASRATQTIVTFDNVSIRQLP